MVEFLAAHSAWFFFGAVPAIYVAMVGLGRWLKRSRGVKLNWTYHLFSFCFATYFIAKLCDEKLTVRIMGTPIPFRRELGAVMCLLGAFFIIALVDRYVWEFYFKEKHRIKVPKFLSEIVTLVIILISVIVILELGYNFKIQGLLIGSGGLAVVIVYAMKDVFANIVSGLALQLGKSFKEGDWLLVNDRYGRVVEINWRTTRFVTVDDIAFEVPNQDFSKQIITNLNLPTREHAMRLSMNIDYAVPPTRVKDILLHATSNAKGVMAQPRPTVYLKTFGDFAIEYEIKFYMDDHQFYWETCDSIRTNVWYSLRRHGIRIPFPIRTVQLERPSRSKEQEIQSAARIMLRQHPLFKTLNDAQLDALLPRGRVVHFGRGEKLIQQGEHGESMFILVSGEANVVVELHGNPTHVASLRSGDCFGEMSLLTGEKRNATVMANHDCEVVEIDKTVLARSLKENPQLLTQLGALLAKRQMETEGIVAVNTKPSVVEATQNEYENSFTAKLTKFFEL